MGQIVTEKVAHNVGAGWRGGLRTLVNAVRPDPLQSAHRDNTIKILEV
ncbi:MAG: hypothetical protein ACOYXT_19855 [Bacteroidota bacterium]